MRIFQLDILAMSFQITLKCKIAVAKGAHIFEKHVGIESGI